MSARETRFERSYRAGFRKATKKLADDQIHLPQSCLDDPDLTREHAYELGYADGRALENGRRAG